MAQKVIVAHSPVAGLTWWCWLGCLPCNIITKQIPIASFLVLFLCISGTSRVIFPLLWGFTTSTELTTAYGEKDSTDPPEAVGCSSIGLVRGFTWQWSSSGNNWKEYIWKHPVPAPFWALMTHSKPLNLGKERYWCNTLNNLNTSEQWHHCNTCLLGKCIWSQRPAWQVHYISI